MDWASKPLPPSPVYDKLIINESAGGTFQSSILIGHTAATNWSNITEGGVL